MLPVGLAGARPSADQDESTVRTAVSAVYSCSADALSRARPMHWRECSRSGVDGAPGALASTVTFRAKPGGVQNRAPPDVRIGPAGPIVRPSARGCPPLVELFVGALVVLGFLAILTRLTPRDAAGRVVLPRIIDDSIGMWALRRLTGRPSGERADDHGPESNSVATATGQPAGPVGSAESQPGDSSPLARRPALAALSFHSTPSRLAAAGVLRVPKAPIRSTRVASIGRRFRAAFMTTGAVQGPTRQVPYAVLERHPPVARYGLSAVRTMPEDRPGRAPRRQVEMTAPARSQSSGAARIRPTLAGVATLLTFGLIGLVAIAAASGPGAHPDRATDAGARPESTYSLGPSNGGRPSASSVSP